MVNNSKSKAKSLTDITPAERKRITAVAAKKTNEAQKEIAEKNKKKAKRTPTARDKSKNTKPKPTKLYLEKKAEIIQWIKGGMNIRDACGLAGVGKSTFYDWTNLFSDFSDDLKKAQLENKAVRINRILQASKQSWQAAAWYLERMYSNEFALKRLLEVKDDRQKDTADILMQKLINQSVIEAGDKLDDDGNTEDDTLKDIPTAM